MDELVHLQVADEVATGAAVPCRTSTTLGDDGTLHHARDGMARRYLVAVDAEGVTWVARDGATWAVHDRAAEEAAAEAVTGSGGPVRSPMPGTVRLVEVTEGQQVTAGQKLVVVEAMKMEHVLTAPVDGTVRELRARPGGAVAKDAVLLTLEGRDGAGEA